MNGKNEKPYWPHWLKDINRRLAVCPHFVLSGNIRDFFLLTDPERGPQPGSLTRCLWEILQDRGFSFLLVFDLIDGVTVYPQDAGVRKSVQDALNVQLDDRGAREMSLDKFPEVMSALGRGPRRMAMMIDYASRICVNPQSVEGEEKRFFLRALKLAHTATQVMGETPDGAPLYNPFFWVVEKEGHLPDWFTVNNDRMAQVTVPLPDFDMRQAAIEVVSRRLSDYNDLDPEKRAEAIRTFTLQTESLTLQSVRAITQLAGDQGIGFAQIGDAVRAFKVGITETPWRQQFLKDRLHAARQSIEQRLKGQTQAVEKTLDILRRSVTGLTGAHTGAGAGRPRGVLFFAGPTGVGKTELAKAMTEVLFGDERAYLRFDMSEFSAEHADARLLGAPPGYVGYESGGELTGAIREKPFCVILFDEIEKAHPRILDKFLQLLDDGRMTDGRGNTVYFSEAVIVFTSNLGTFVEQEDPVTGRVQRILNVKPGEPYGDVERKIRQAIEEHFKFVLNRPELLNRIGDNIVVFDFIQPAVAAQIFEKMWGNIASRVQDEHQITLEIAPDVRESLLAGCTADLAMGGRGIGNQLETIFINPLARAIFERSWPAGTRLQVVGLECRDNIHSLRLEMV